MDYKVIWNEICFFMKKSHNVSERDFQTTVEFLFEKLGWSQYKGEIVSQVIIPVGSSQSVKPDIVIKNNGQNIFVVELKKPNSVLSSRNADQLISYMRLLKLNIGILIGENFQLYYDLPNDNKEPVKIDDIDFLQDSNTGQCIIELLSKDNFSNEKIDKYCIDKLKYLDCLEKCQQYINFICSDEGNNFIIELIKGKISDEFTDSMIDTVINKIEINISKKENLYSETYPSLLISSKSDYSSKKLAQNSISKSTIKDICKSNGIVLEGNITLASKNKASAHYWANPNVKYLSTLWWLILNDSNSQELHIFKIPANSILKSQIKIRNDKPERIDIQIKYEDRFFEDSRSGIKFLQWFVKTIPYHL